MRKGGERWRCRGGQRGEEDMEKRSVVEAVPSEQKEQLVTSFISGGRLERERG